MTSRTRCFVRTVDGAELLLVRAGQDLLVERLCVLVLALLQVAGGLGGREAERNGLSTTHTGDGGPLWWAYKFVVSFVFLDYKHGGQ